MSTSRRYAQGGYVPAPGNYVSPMLIDRGNGWEAMTVVTPRTLGRLLCRIDARHRWLPWEYPDGATSRRTCRRCRKEVTLTLR